MTLILETPRLVLRSLESRDADTLVRELNNFAIARNTARVPHPYHRDDALDFLAFSENLNEKSCVAGVELKEAGGLVGVISYEWSEAKQDAELGYWFSQPVWGKGIGTEAASAMVDRAFARSGHQKIIACYHNDNAASARILHKLGFKVVGPCTSFSKAQGREVEVTNMQLLQAHWLKKKAATN